MQVSLIVAMSRNRVIGADGGLPWRLRTDLRRFKKLTMGHTLVVGRVTWESIGRALPGRRMVVVTRQAAFQADGVEFSVQFSRFHVGGNYAVHGGVLPAGVSPVLWSQAMLGVALVIAATGFFRLRDPVFLAALAWAAVGIAHKTGQAPGIAVPAMALAGLAGLAMISLLRRGVGPARPPQSTTG